jgi:hypothetical protein
MRVCFWTIIACLAPHGLAAQVADERNRDDVAAHWRAITAIDLEAAYRLIHDNHPGAAREVRDTGFQGRLEAAHSAALERTTHVTDVNGYLATLSGFGVQLGDKHLFLERTITPRLAQWPGFIGGDVGRWRVPRT